MYYTPVNVFSFNKLIVDILKHLYYNLSRSSAKLGIKKSDNLTLRGIKIGRRGESLRQEGVPPGKLFILPQQMVAAGDQLVTSFCDF